MKAIFGDVQEGCGCGDGICHCIGKTIVSCATEAVEEVVKGIKNGIFVNLYVPLFWPVVLPANLLVAVLLPYLNEEQKKTVAGYTMINIFQDIDPTKDYSWLKTPYGFFCGPSKASDKNKINDKTSLQMKIN
jgi:hypothetical protein